MVTGDDAAGAEVGVQVGQVGDPADVRRLVQRHDHAAGPAARRAVRRGVPPPASRCRTARRSAAPPPTGTSTAGTGCRGWRRTRPGRTPAAMPRRGGVTQAMISRVGHRLGGGAGGLVDAVPGLGGAVLRAAQRGGHGGEPGVGRAVRRAWGRRARSATRRRRAGCARTPAAARNSAASRSWAAGPHRSRRCSSATVRTKCPASRWASSTVRSPRSRFHHQACGW